ncbi:hypothetical protein ACFVOR_11595 [Streptomyces sp. NPDC057837]|uniref:hypothetical protein n=1 Tax=Streptomyces sp. NPDC057837 TaxID=3346260 RepID=UPI00367BFC7B
MWFQDPGHVSDVTLRAAAEKALAGMPGSVRAAWTAAMEEARKDILGSGTVLETKQYTGTYDHRYDSWDMPVELGIGIDAIDDGTPPCGSFSTEPGDSTPSVRSCHTSTADGCSTR